MKKRRDGLLTIAIVALLVVLTIVGALSEAGEARLPALSSHSSSPDGARALGLWLAQIGHSVDNAVTEQFAIPDGAEAVLILEPALLNPITDAEWETLTEWVSEGGFLLIASGDARFGGGDLLKVKKTLLNEESYALAAAGPFLLDPPLEQPVKLNLNWSITSAREEALPLLAVSEGPVALEIPQGKGQILLIANSQIFSNAALKDTHTARLALNLLDGIPQGAVVWFDEWHHGERPKGSRAAGPQAWLFTTPSGLALLFAAAACFVGLALSGQRFGRAVPLPSEQVRRAPLEYVTAIANLSRRAGHRRALMQYYRARIKRAFGQRYRLDAGLPDEEYVTRLSRYKPDLDAPALLELLKKLDRRQYSETQIVQLAREAAHWLKDFE